MKQIFSLLICLPIITYAQMNGVKFEEGLNWEQVQRKAKAENKYIFVDCFATWCGPCKLMDKYIYPNDTVGNYMNAHFISVKVQMDTTDKDNEDVQRWYPIANNIWQQYNLSALPTYLFFSSCGTIVHKDIGAKTVNDFIALAKTAFDPNKQYYTLLGKYRAGKMSYTDMPELATICKNFKETALALGIASNYMRNYLDKLNDEDLYTKKNLDFIARFGKMVNTKDKIFDLYYHYANKVDSVMEDPGYSARMANYIIYKEEISSILEVSVKKGVVPDWKNTFKLIEHRYNHRYATSQLIDAKVIWYKQKKEWKIYCKFLVQQANLAIKNNDSRGNSSFNLNNWAWDIFLFSNNEGELNEALQWSDMTLKSDPYNSSYLDTNANLLYKLGRKTAAIAAEEKAIQASPKQVGYEIALDNLKKMRKGLPTWQQE